MTTKRFSEISEILNDRLKEFAGGKSRRKAAVTVANTLGISADAIDSWRRGTRCIPEEKIEPLVRALEFTDARGALTAEGSALVRELSKAREQAEVKRSWRERVEEGDMILQVREADYLGAGHFWSRIVYPFLDAACITHAAGEDEHMKCNFQQLQASLWAGDVHLALGILSTPRLGLKLSFFNSPINYRLNGVMLKTGVDRLRGPQHVRDLLAQRASRARRLTLNELGPSRFFHPVVMKGEVGEAYVKHNLKIVDVVELESLEAKVYSDALIAGGHRRDDRTRIAVADEITCLSILRLLRGRGRLVFPLVPDNRDRRALIPPSFPLGIAISRNEKLAAISTGALQTFIHEGLAQHIQGNARSIAFSYLALKNKVRQLVDQALPAAPPAMRDEWTARTFRLGDRLESWRLEPPHWRAVLREAALMAEQGTGAFNRDSAGPGNSPSGGSARDGLM